MLLTLLQANSVLNKSVLNDNISNVLSRGYNHYTLQNCNTGTSTHAEVSAINNLPSTKKKININIYVIRIDRNGNRTYSKPCPNCQKFMKSTLLKRGYCLKKIIYSANENEFEYMKL
jgi:cytidine deaminase